VKASHGASVAVGPNPQNGRSARRATRASDAPAWRREQCRSREAMIAWRQSAGRVQAGQGRKPAEPVARSASPDGPAAVRQRLAPSDHGSESFDEPDRQREVRAVPRRALISGRLSRRSGATHLAWCRGKLSKNNVQTNAYDQNRPAAHRGFYLALDRSAARAPPSLRGPSPTTIRQNSDPASRQHIPCRFVAVVMPTLRVYERASCVARSTEAGTRELRRLCPLFAERAQEGGNQQVSVGRGNVRCCG
jgi:hypothetical protein